MRHPLRQHPCRLQPVALLALLVACGSRATTATGDGGLHRVAAASAEDPAANAFRRFAGSGLDAVHAFSDTCDRAAYLALRRSALASMETWRRSFSFSAEVTFGPEI